LKNILEKLLAKNKINLRNFDLYYFVEHNENQKEYLEEMENALNNDLQLKFLNNFDLDV